MIITAYLLHSGSNENPNKLAANRKIAFKGAEPGSLGFLVDPTDPLFGALAGIRHPSGGGDMLLKRYIGGEDVTDDSAGRYVLDVDDLTLQQMDQLPIVKAYLEDRVRVDFLKRGEVEEDTIEWWHFRRPTLGLRDALASVDRCFVCSRHSPHLALIGRSAKEILAESMVVFADERLGFFAIIQSRLHEIWARREASSMKDDLRYTPTDCFETFPFPLGWQANKALAQIGERYYQNRAELMTRADKGLTDTYNRFHDKCETDTEIETLRRLHAEMDREVLAAYGWTDLEPRLDFILDYTDDNDEEGATNDCKKPWRYRWVDEDRDEVLARLLELNRLRAEEEAQSTPAVPAGNATGKRSRKSGRSAPVAAPSLFDVQEPTE